MSFKTAFIQLFLTLIILSLAIIACSPNEEKIEDPLYQEPHRNQFHFSPEANWMNDPNGMVFYEGEYHLFYQYYPDSTVWGPMHWGHAVSKDMVHWEHLPIALYPDSLGYIFSGSAVIDWDNTSGLGVDGTPPMIAFFTHHEPNGARAETLDFQYQSIAFSNDKGRTWTKYSGNPVIGNPGIKDFRDPKVIWDGDQWVMVFAAFDRIKFYTSDNLIEWTFASDFGMGYGAQGRPWECPDFFYLDAPFGNEGRWILIVSIGKGALNGGSGTQYFTGSWDGTTFSTDQAKETIKWIDYGKDNYAGVTWSDIPERDGRRIFLGWMSNWQYAQIVPTERWRSAMTLPRELQLVKEGGEFYLKSLPVSELDQLTVESKAIPRGIADHSLNLLDLLEIQDGLYRIDLSVMINDTFGLDIQYGNDEGQAISFGYDSNLGQYYVDRTFSGESSFSKDFAGLHSSTPQTTPDGAVNMTVFLDHASIEVFADDGRVVFTEIFFPKSQYNSLKISNSSEKTEIVDGKISALKSIW